MSDPRTISESEAYSGSYRVFWQAVRMLSQSVVDQCKAMGNYNVAWELKDDISAGSYLLTSSACQLNAAQRRGIAELIKELEGVPSALLAQATSAAANEGVMGHAFWVPIRSKAARLLQSLPAPEL
jgi:hypothetical protein